MMVGSPYKLSSYRKQVPNGVIKHLLGLRRVLPCEQFAEKEKARNVFMWKRLS